ncbi:PDDEXK nuclease domain-containing protein [Ruminococcus sp. HUN007]|uniref:PDDEXK nuclease domain-containing protein n=1 Tax=Ruminococcus sp. HUN007 TaxID=1514668 RepID=UPI0005D24FFD|nr:PDDEXK nuclease domain-containing protein [Ruminococcus sp. HUN007]
MSTLLKADKEYKEWIADISNRFRQSQIKAAVKVNSEMLKFYWSIGRDISQKNFTTQYGSGFYKRLSFDLKELLPTVKAFSETNLRYMAWFYDLYSLNPQQVVVDLEDNEKQFSLGKDYISESVFFVPWGHHIQIIGKCRDDQQKALFYVEKVIENHWSRAVLLNFLDTDLYERQGKAITNFKNTLPEVQSDLAQEMTRDPYNFDFLTLTERYNEKELKDAIMDNITKFLLELGSGFSFVGREYRVEIGGKENFIDMLFFNINLKCYVVLEVKVTEFEPSFAGQLGTYVVAVNHQLKEDWQNPAIGLIVCKSLDSVEAQYALESTSQPLGVSSYELSKLIPENFKGSLPTIEEIEAELNEDKHNEQK